MDIEIKKAYDRGIRAYYRNGDCEFINQFGERTVWSSLQDWIDLRAYQDEQRKKGVPMLLDQYRDGITVHVDEKQNRTVTRFFTFTNGNSLIEQQFNEVYTAKFTNFRWRAGYPKPVKLEHCQGDNCPSQHSCLDGCMYPKGGQNG